MAATGAPSAGKYSTTEGQFLWLQRRYWAAAQLLSGAVAARSGSGSRPCPPRSHQWLVCESTLEQGAPHRPEVQQKPSRPVQFEITEQTRAAIRDWLGDGRSASGQFLFPSRVRNQPHISTRQYARIVHRWVERAGLDSSAYGTHSMRRTKAAQIYKKTGNLRAVQLLLGHTKLESTVRYLGIEVDDALSISEQVEL